MSTDDVCLVSTWDVPCGIARYTAGLRDALAAEATTTTVLPIDRVALRDLSRQELAQHFVELGKQASRHPVVHLQHEFGFFGASYNHPESVANLRRFLRAASGHGARIVITFHSLPPVPSWPSTGLVGVAREQFLAQLWRRRVAPMVDGRRIQAVAPSRYQRRLLIDSGIRADAITVVPQGAPALHEHGSTRAEAKAAHGIDEAATVVLQFGFVATYKGHLVSLEAVRQLPRSVHLVVLGGPHTEGGDAAYEHLLAFLARRPNLAKRVHVTGWVPDEEVQGWFTAADLCVAPYVNAGLVTSAAAVWALASGRPLVASRIPAFRELAADADCVELVAPSSPHELAEAILRLASDDQRAKTLVENATALCERWAWPAIAVEHRRIYGLS